MNVISEHTQVHTQQGVPKMFQNLVLLLALIGPLGPLLFVEGQEFRGYVGVV